MMGGIQGFEQLSAKLRGIAGAGNEIAAAGTVAALVVMGNAAVATSPGTIGNEVGVSLSKPNDGVVSGKVGLGVGKGSRVRNRHGRFLTAGTKYITARHFIRRALEGSVGPAAAAMRRAVKSKLESLARGK